MLRAKNIKCKSWKLLQKTGAAVLDVICPQTCLICNKQDTDSQTSLCPSCLAAVNRAVVMEYCPRCGETTPPFGRSDDGCGKCRTRNLPYDSVTRIGAYKDKFARLVRIYKYGHREELTGFFATRMSALIMRSEMYELIDFITAVPTCWLHRLYRPFHAADVLGKSVAKRCYIPYRSVLRRSEGGRHQVGLPYTVRRNNVKGKFRVIRSKQVCGASICLIDDVMTSGATIEECARVLKKAGADRVYVAVVARAGSDPATLRYI